jgi:hypothetical protein
VLRNDFTGLWADYRYDQQTAALRALARVNTLDENYLVELYGRRKSMDATALADLASTMAERPSTFASNLGALKGELWDSLLFKLVKGQQVFDGVRGDRPSWGGLYLGSAAATTAAVWEALLKLDPANPRHTLIRDALLSKAAAGNGFGSTHANRRSLAALGVYLERSSMPQPKVSVAISGIAQEVVLDDAKKAARRSLDADAPVSITVKGASIGARVQTRYLPVTSGDKVEAKKEGLIVSRSLTWLHSDNSAPTRHEDAVGTSLKLPVGDVVEVHAQLINDEPRHQVALVVPIAAGLEPMNPALENASADAKPSQADSLEATYVQRLDSEVRYYFTDLPRGTFTFHFRARASNEGSFVHPPPYAELMYREEVRGRGVGMRIVVTGEREK